MSTRIPSNVSNDVNRLQSIDACSYGPGLGTLDTMAAAFAMLSSASAAAGGGGGAAVVVVESLFSLADFSTGGGGGGTAPGGGRGGGASHCVLCIPCHGTNNGVEKVLLSLDDEVPIVCKMSQVGDTERCIKLQLQMQLRCAELRCVFVGGKRGEDRIE